jgi:pimeloyl-[acyl-carrier protein] methyl ester esterase
MRSPEPVLVLLHGWGMHASLFDALSGALAEDFEVRALSLPGHGGRAALPCNTLSDWGDDLARQLQDGACVLGWSLGGQVAMRAALDHPEKIARLILLSSTPRFVAGDSWAHGMTEDALAAFGAALRTDPQATLLRFLSLQTRGAAGQKALLQQVRQRLLHWPRPDVESLEGGLAILRETDLRDELARLAQPTLVLHGASDTLTPPGAGAWLAASLPAAQHVEWPHAAHALHLSHPAEVASAIRRFAHV